MSFGWRDPRLEEDNHLFLLEKEGGYIGTLELKSPKAETLEFFDLPSQHVKNYKVLEIDKLSIQEDARGLGGMIELFEAAVAVGKELNADYFIQFMRKGFLGVLKRRYGFHFYASSSVLIENNNKFIPVMLDVKDASGKFEKLQSNVEKAQ
ncbi:hypothetical protein BC30090_p346 (plasmid) [Bacillus cereus]|nr:hypothetical protein BC30090_p346 [Bacillus cereus]